MNKVVLLGLLAHLLFANTAYALPSKNIKDCEERSKSVNQLSQCLDGVKEAIDRELQTWVNNQTFVLEEFALVSGRHSALEMFKRSQRNFITYRENNCRWQYLAISPSTGAASSYKKCYVLLSKDRISELSNIQH